jgi:Fur family transcriptional regulator, peroxide stress response regulator
MSLSPWAMKRRSESAEVKQRLNQILSKLKDHDFRITPQRLAVLRILAASEKHPTVDKIFEEVRSEFSTTSLATIYKTISLLKEINEVLELGFADGSNRYDGNRPFPHPHVVCTQCKKIIDPELSSLIDMTKEVADETGFKILTHRLDFFGICGECLNKKK